MTSRALARAARRSRLISRGGRGARRTPGPSMSHLPYVSLGLAPLSRLSLCGAATLRVYAPCTAGAARRTARAETPRGARARGGRCGVQLRGDPGPCGCADRATQKNLPKHKKQNIN